MIATARRKEKLIELQNKYPDNIHIISADISKEEERKKIIDEIQTRFKKIDCFVNNAAIITPLTYLKEVSQEEFTEILTVNVIAPVMLANQLLPYLQGGRILDVSSPASYMPLSGIGAYNIAKAALAMVTKLCHEQV